MRRDGVREEIRYFFGRHGSVYIREVGYHLSSPTVEEIQRHQFVR